MFKKKDGFKRMKKIHHINSVRKKVERVLLILDLMDSKTRRNIRDRETLIMINGSISEKTQHI